MSDIKSLLPHTSNDFARDLEIVTAERLEAIKNPLRDLWNVDTCPTHLLPWLAWAFSVEVWDHNWTEKIKRNVIRSAIELHRIKGIRRSVELALEALNMRIDLHEWFELDEYGAPYGPAHTFKIDAFADEVFEAGYHIDTRLRDIVIELIRDVKPVHVHFHLRIGETFATDIGVSTGIRQKQRFECHHDVAPRTELADITVQIRMHTRTKILSQITHNVETRMVV